MTRLRRLFTLLACVCMVFTTALSVEAAPGVGGASSNADYTTASSFKAETEECAFLGLINAYRVKNGLGELAMSKSLSAAADDHSADMAKNNVFSHTFSNGTTWSENITSHGYPTGTSRAENIAAGRETASQVLDQWKNSPPHNDNMLSSKYKAIGIGRYKVSGSRYTWYWTTTFGSKVDSTYTCSSGSSAGSNQYPITAGGRSSSSTSAMLAADGDLKTSWYTTKTSPPRTAYVYFDLGSTKSISKIEWYFGQNGGLGSFSVEISTDKTNWTTITTRSTAKAGNWVSSAVNKQGRYVRFYFKNPDSLPTLGYLAEVRIYP